MGNFCTNEDHYLETKKYNIELKFKPELEPEPEPESEAESAESAEPEPEPRYDHTVSNPYVYREYPTNSYRHSRPYCYDTKYCCE